MHPVLFHLGSIVIPSDGALAAVGVLAGLLLAQRTARRAGVNPGQVWNLCVIALFAAIVAQRLLLVGVNWSVLRSHPSWMLAMAMIHHPLLAALGALAGAGSAALYVRWQQMPLASTADALAPPLALGLAFEQAGALMAGSGYGTEATVRWAVTYTDPLAARWSGTPLGVPLHPVQAYAALAFLALSAFLLVVCQGTTLVVPYMQPVNGEALSPAGRFFAIFPSSWLPLRRRQGDVAGLWLLGMGVAVYITELWRDREGRGALLGGALDGPQVAAILMVLAGGLVLLDLTNKKRGRA